MPKWSVPCDAKPTICSLNAPALLLDRTQGVIVLVYAFGCVGSPSSNEKSGIVMGAAVARLRHSKARRMRNFMGLKRWGFVGAEPPSLLLRLRIKLFHALEAFHHGAQSRGEFLGREHGLIKFF